MKPWLRRLLVGRSGRPDKLITAVVRRDEPGGWSLSWVGDGRWPTELRASTLTELVEQASAAVTDLYARYPPVAGAELQFAIYPWDYHRGPMFAVEKHDQLFIARDELGGGHELQANSLGDLITTAEHDYGADSMLHWVRP
ncbi:MAG TPA: hypothetical protein VFR11_01760, partial [Micromonosporaceae bacterium]|nr:hypothetical protein [Micromonosporaceae bacterium]